MAARNGRLLSHEIAEISRKRKEYLVNKRIAAEKRAAKREKEAAKLQAEIEKTEAQLEKLKNVSP